MFREGGWAVPLQCDSPALQNWLGRLHWVCSILGVTCDTYVSPELGVCPRNWTPLAIMGTSVIFLAGLLLMLLLAAKNFFRSALFPPASSNTCGVHIASRPGSFAPAD